MKRKLFWVVGLALVLLVTITPAAAGPVTSDLDRDSLVFTGSIHVAENEVYNTVVSLNGSIIVDGRVDNAISLNGPVVVNGRVDNTVISLSSRVRITENAMVDGDVYAPSEPTIEPGAEVKGTSGALDPTTLLVPLEVISRLAWWIAVSISTLALGLLLAIFGSKVADTAFAIARSDMPTVTGVGLAVFVGLPLVGIAITITGVGVPLGIGLLLALALFYAIAYVAAAWLLGRLVVNDPGRRVLAFFAGWALLRAGALIPVIGGVVWFAAVVLGLGVLTIEAWRASRPSTASTSPSMTTA